MRTRRSGSQVSTAGRNLRTDRIPFGGSSHRKRADKEEPLKSTRERILDAAERLFAQPGFNSVSMPAIARASGITAGAIYKHFDSKADLLFEVVKRAVQSIQVSIASGSGPDAMRIPRLVAMYTDSNLKLLRQLSLEVHSASTRHPRVRRILRRALDRDVQELRCGIMALQKAGKLDAAMDTEFLANAVIAFMMGLAHMETIAPQLVGDPKWRAFVQGRTAALLGVSARWSDSSAKPGNFQAPE